MGMDIEIILVSRQVWYLFFFFQKGRGVNSTLLLLENLQKDICISVIFGLYGCCSLDMPIYVAKISFFVKTLSL